MHARPIEQVISSNFTAAPPAEELVLDDDTCGDNDYTVDIALPQCVFASQAFGADPSSIFLPPAMTVSSTWNTVWDIQATVARGRNVGGSSVVVPAGVRTLLTEAQENVVCPT